jgi:hypothetical protein
MANLKNILFSALLLCGLASCRNTDENVGSPVTGYDTEVSAECLSSLISDFECLQLECKPECLLTNINKIEMTDSLLIISDMEHLFAFTKDGKFSHVFGAKGNAENEYIVIGTFMIDPEGKVVLVDPYSGKFIYFRQNGEFISSTKVDQSILMNIQDGCFVDKDKIFTSQYIYNDQNTAFTLIDLKKKTVQDVAKTPLRTDNTMERIGFHPFSHYQDSIKWILPFEPKVYGLNSGCIYDILTSETVCDNLGEINNFSIMTYMDFMQKNMFIGFTDIFETSGHIILPCSNLDCTIINKKDLSCRHFFIESGKIASMQLFGMRYAGGDTLIGMLMPFQLQNMEFAENCDAGLLKLKTLKQSFDKDGNPIILFYSIE